MTKISPEKRAELARVAALTAALLPKARLGTEATVRAAFELVHLAQDLGLVEVPRRQAGRQARVSGNGQNKS